MRLRAAGYSPSVLQSSGPLPAAEVLAALRTVPLFVDSPDLAARVAAIATHQHIRAGGFLFRRGEAGDALYVVLSGMLEVLDEHHQETRAVLGRGEVIGELALVTGEARSASVRARRDSELVVVSADGFSRLLDTEPALWRALAEVLAQRLRREATTTRGTPQLPPRTIALVPLHENLPLAALAAELRGQLEGSAELEPSGGSAADHARALDSLESAHAHVLLLAAAPGTDDEWTAFCVRQADRVVAVARAGAGVRAATDELVGCDLALVGAGPSAGLHAALGPAHRYRLGAGAPFGVQAMARRLAGRSVGLVLSGGGARGCAHLGVIAELEAFGFSVDRVGGTSMGALIGALLARGLGAGEITERVRAEFALRNPLGDYTLPLVAVTRGRKGEGMLTRLFDGLQIEDLEREFFCVSADIVRSEVVVHRSGPLVEAVGASVALPGYVPPVMSGARLLVDGGAMNNLPTQFMDRAEGPIVAVNVRPRGERESVGSALGGTRPRLRRAAELARLAITGAAQPRPNLLETISRSIVLGSTRADLDAELAADLVIAPDVAGIDLLAWGRLDETRELGAKATREALERDPPALAGLRSSQRRP